MGHKRTNIYLSNLIITTITSLFSYILFIVIIAIVGIPLFGGITISISNLLALLGCIFITIIAYSSIFTFIAMLLSSKTISAIVSIMLVIVASLNASVCLEVLQAQEYVQVGQMVDGEMKFDLMKNEKYPTDEERKMYQTMLDITPAGQMFQIAGGIATNLKLLPIYSIGIVVMFTSCGLILFNKKELK